MKPEDMKFSKTHEWVFLEGNTAVVGITEHAVSELGDIVFVEVKDKGEELSQAGQFGTVESTKAASELYSPVSGKIIEVNEEAVNSPQIINEDPYGKGWLAKIEVKDISEINSLLNYAEYQQLVNS